MRKRLLSFFLVSAMLLVTLATCMSGAMDDPSDWALPEIRKAQDYGLATDNGKTLTVHYIDVGQGDAVFIQTPSQNVLIDGGEKGTTVADYLKQQGVSCLDIVISTHPHSDHIGGLINVLENFTVKEVIDPGVVHTTKAFEDYLTLIDKKDIKFTVGRAGMSRDLGNGIGMQILHPASPSKTELNDASIVTRVTFGQVSFMFTGDAEIASELQMLDADYELGSTVLKVGHHGSKTSTSETFLRAVNPKIAIIMAGSGNVYGHPDEETLAKLSSADIDIYRTDIHGTIVIATDGQTLTINIDEPYQYESHDPHNALEANQYPACIYDKKVESGNEIRFDSAKEAKDNRYVPWGVCKPPGSLGTRLISGRGISDESSYRSF